jgi:plasminogen activator
MRVADSKSILLAAMMGIASTGAFADGYLKDEQPVVQRYTGGVTLETSIGVMDGEANEFVYNPDGSVLSQLIWTFDDVVVVNADLAIQPLSWLTFGVRGSINITDDSTMDDFDFPGAVCGIPGPFCHSHHEHTSLNKYAVIDAYVAGTVFSQSNANVKLLAGYKRQHQEWDAFDGVANYAVFPPGIGISYEQTWQAPYIGVQADGEWHNWIIGARVIGSWWVDSEDQDIHHLRQLKFNEEFGESDMVGANAKIGYRLTSNVSILGSYDYQKWDVAKGPTIITDLTNGKQNFLPGNAAGAESENHTWSLGARVDF